MTAARTTVTVRERRPEDLPALVEALTAQQPFSRYPLRWPLPFPVEDFLVRENEEVAWVAEVDGRAVGHVMVGRPREYEAGAFAAATGCDDLACVSVLFVAREVQGTGLGGLLLDTAVAWADARGRLPVLDVVPSHGTAVQVYRHRGFTVVGELRPPWLPEHDAALLLMARLPSGNH